MLYEFATHCVANWKKYRNDPNTAYVAVDDIVIYSYWMGNCWTREKELFWDMFWRRR